MSEEEELKNLLMETNKCSACKKEFAIDEKVVRADCGCLVHVFKVNCNEDDYCRNCDRKFHVFANAPLIKVDAEKLQKKTVDDIKKPFSLWMEQLDLRFTTELDKQHKTFDEKFQEQRKINLEMMKKLNVLSRGQEDLVKIFREQTLESKKIIDTLTRIITQELVEMKNDISNLKDDYENIIDSISCHEHECDHDDETE